MAQLICTPIPQLQPQQHKLISLASSSDYIDETCIPEANYFGYQTVATKCIQQQIAMLYATGFAKTSHNNYYRTFSKLSVDITLHFQLLSYQRQGGFNHGVNVSHLRP